MSVYNGEAYLEEAIESVINQTFKSWELIVINDCSTDSTSQILAKIAATDDRIRVYTNEVNLKLPSSLNKAISFCTGKYIARMDADDICLSNRLEKQYRFMEDHPNITLSSCRFMTVKNGIYTPGGAGARCDHDAIQALLLMTNPILHPGVIAKADILKKLNYDTSLTCTEDLELWTRMAAENYQLQIQPEYLFIYRLHDKQITSTSLERQHTEVLKIEQKYYASLLQEMDSSMQQFYISGIYFKENANIQKFLEYAKWIRSIRGSRFKKSTVNYALFEILAEYKRCGISKKDIVKAMFTFCPVFLVKEIIRRKIASAADIKKCITVAKAIGLKQTAGTAQYPIFEK